MRKACIILAFWLQAASILAASLRVTAWNLQSTNTFDTNLVQEAADALKKQNPDVILLQHVADWKTCAQIAEALRPAKFQVAACSSWPDSRQTAILTKSRAAISWSEKWQTNRNAPDMPGGFSFAAVKSGGKIFALLSFELAENRAAPGLQQFRKECVRQLSEQIITLQDWKNNRPDTFLVGGDFSATLADLRLGQSRGVSRFKEIGLKNPFGPKTGSDQNLPARSSVDCLFSRQAEANTPPELARTAHIENYLVTCDFTAVAPEPIPAMPRAPTVAKAIAAPIPAPKVEDTRLVFWIAGCLICGVALFVFVRIAMRKPAGEVRPVQVTGPARAARLTGPSNTMFIQVESGGSTLSGSQNSSTGSVVKHIAGPTPDEVRESVVANMAWWLKQKVLRRLVTDRSALIATRNAAALKALAVDARLTRIENHIQQQNKEYEQRIDVLMKALSETEEQNRELIQSQIALIKAEMEKARLRAEREEF